MATRFVPSALSLSAEVAGPECRQRETEKHEPQTPEPVHGLTGRGGDRTHAPGRIKKRKRATERQASDGEAGSLHGPRRPPMP